MKSESNLHSLTNTAILLSISTSSIPLVHSRDLTDSALPMISMQNDARSLVEKGTRTRRHTRTHARTHAHSHAHTHARTHKHTPTHTHTRTHAHTHARARTHTHAHAPTRTHAHALTHHHHHQSCRPPRKRRRRQWRLWCDRRPNSGAQMRRLTTHRAGNGSSWLGLPLFPGLVFDV